jgi:hypothetical protein
MLLARRWKRAIFKGILDDTTATTTSTTLSTIYYWITDALVCMYLLFALDAYMQEAYPGSYRQSSLGECLRTIINNPLFL